MELTPYQKIDAINRSNIFSEIRTQIIVGELFQREYLSAKKFHEYCSEFGYRLIWEIEFDFCIRQGWLLPCFQYNNDQKYSVFALPKTKNKTYLDKIFFHPYKILEVFSVADKHNRLRDFLLIWWLKKSQKRESLKYAKKYQNFSIFNFHQLSLICELAIALEPIYLPIISGRVTYRNLVSDESYWHQIGNFKSALIDLAKNITASDWRVIHDQINFISGVMDSNSEFKTLITLMRLDDQRRIKGHLGAALIVREIAQLIRYFAKDCGTELQEEQFSESPGFTDGYFAHLRGSKSIVEGSRANKLKFVRGFNLDFSIRVRLYVEGATEYNCFKSIFGDNGTIEIIDLKGAFSQKGGKGLAFRDSLRNDMSHNIYSLIVLDGDRNDNIRVVRDAAAKEEFLGQFYISNPDIEFGNFNLKEICAIINDNFNSSITVSQLNGVGTGKSLIGQVKKLGIDLEKGECWGKMLGCYAIEHPNSNPLGMPNKDRIINQVVRFIQFSNYMNFANDVVDKYVDSTTGLMQDRDKILAKEL